MDVGCGEGTTAAYIKKQMNIEKADGIESNELSYRIALQKLDVVYKTDLNKEETPFNNITEKYDLLLFLDVLEHLINPYKVLEQSKNLLKDNGKVIISLPNARHYTLLFPLLFKNEWEYQEQGVLDKTHLRFFTYKSALRLIDKAGYKVAYSTRNYSYYRGFKILNIIFLGLLSPFSISQYIFDCVKKDTT
jgi:2-polyprenyl-3-methyl-5-hydroxy-6-metoxy-1,4-benzoquinol methylase